MRARLLNLLLACVKMSAYFNTSIDIPCKPSSRLENSSCLVRAASGVGVPVTHSQLSLGKISVRKLLPCFSNPS